MCWGREDRGIQDNLVKGSVRLLVLYNRIAFCPFQGCLSASPGQEGGSGMSGYSKVKGAVQDVGSIGSLDCVQKIPQERGLT